MQSSPSDIKNRLLKALDKEYNVVDMAAVIEIITILERTPISKEALESTRLGKFVNELRRKTSSEPLARRAKDLVRRWRNMIARPPPDPAPPPPTNGRHAPSTSPASHPLVSPRLSAHPLAGHHLSSHSPLVSPRLSAHPLVSPRLSAHPLVSPRLSAHPLAGHHLSSHSPLVSPRLSTHPLASPHLMGGSLTSPALSRSVLSPPVSVHSDASSANRRTVAAAAAVAAVDIESVPRTHAANKRLRKASPDGRPAKVAKLNGMTAVEVFGECSRDSFNASERSESVVEIFPEAADAPPPPPTPMQPKKRGRKKGSTKEALTAARNTRHEDIVKSSIASIARTPKVKTTRELMAGLNRAPGATAAAAVTAAAAAAAADSYASRSAADALEMSRNKTEHIARFLRSQSEYRRADEDEDSDVKIVETAASRPPSPELPPADRPPLPTLAEILAALPPLPDDVDLEDDDDEPTERRGDVTDAEVATLGKEHRPGVNGTAGDGEPRDADDDGFREWHECVSMASYRGELLHILPYVVID